MSLPCSLCVQVRPSQPSRQIQEKEAPLPTQVPPFTQGLGRQLLFLAVRRGGGSFSPGPAQALGLHTTSPTQTGQTDPGRGAGAALKKDPSAHHGRGSGAGEGPCPVVTGASGAPHQRRRCCPSSRGGRHSGRCPRCHSRSHRCCRCTCRTGTRLWAHGPLSRRAPDRQGQGRRPGPAGTHVSGRSCLSSRRRTHSRSR